MHIELEKEILTINQPLAESNSETSVSGDIIVPDRKPDIARILYVDGKAHIDSKEISSGRVITGGRAEFTVLYLPEDDYLPARNLTLSLPFTEVSDFADIEPDAKIQAHAKVEDIEYTLINGRRVNIKATVLLHIKVSKQQKTPLTINITSDIPLNMRTKTIEAYNVAGESDTSLIIADKIEVPAGNAPVSDVLKMDAEVLSQEIKLIRNRAVLKGIIKLSTLYLSPAPDSTLNFMEHEMPFTEIIDLPGADENMAGEVDFEVASVYYETDDDNESTILGVEIKLNVLARATASDKISIIDDCFSVAGDVLIDYENKCIDKIVNREKENITVLGTVNLPPTESGISSVYAVNAEPYIESISSENSTVTANGELKVSVLYKTQDDAYPIQSFSGVIPFSCNFQMNASDSAIFECSASLLGCSYTLSSDTSVDIRANVCISLILMESDCTNIISDVTYKDEEQKRSPLTVYFATDGDTLWDIAKKYKTPPERIAAINSLEEDAVIKSGTKLIIM